MTVAEYISQTFLDFGVKLSDAAIFGIAMRNHLDPQSNLVAGIFSQAEIAVVKSVPLLLLTPQSVAEGSLSISRAQRDSISEFYRLRCKELGLKDELTRKPKVTIL